MSTPLESFQEGDVYKKDNCNAQTNGRCHFIVVIMTLP